MKTLNSLIVLFVLSLLLGGMSFSCKPVPVDDDGQDSLSAATVKLTMCMEGLLWEGVGPEGNEQTWWIALSANLMDEDGNCPGKWTQEHSEGDQENTVGMAAVGEENGESSDEEEDGQGVEILANLRESYPNHCFEHQDDSWCVYKCDKQTGEKTLLFCRNGRLADIGTVHIHPIITVPPPEMLARMNDIATDPTKIEMVRESLKKENVHLLFPPGIEVPAPHQ